MQGQGIQNEAVETEAVEVITTKSNPNLARKDYLNVSKYLKKYFEW